MATPTQQYNYKQGFEVGVAGFACLERSQSIFYRLDKDGVAGRVGFFRFGEVGNQSTSCFGELRFTLNYFTFHFYIYSPDSKKSDRSAIHTASNTPTFFQRCRDIAIR